MTFGRQPNDPLSSPGFGPGPSSSSLRDAPYADGIADGFGGRGPAADGFGRPPAPLAAGSEGATGQSDDERLVTRAELDEDNKRDAALDALRSMLAIKFTVMGEAITDTCGKLLGPKRKASGFLVDLVNGAAAAAVAGAAGVVAERLARRFSARVTLAGSGFVRGYERFVTDAIKDTLKKSVHLGLATRFEAPDERLAAAFRLAQLDKLRAGERNFHATFASEMAGVSTEDLQAAVVRANADSGDGEVRAAVGQQVAVEWANLLARVHHGAGDWDPWAGPLGSDGAVPTHDAAPPKSFAGPGAPAISAYHASSGNVDHDSESIQDAADDDQRPMNPTLHGILEINLWGSGMVDDGQSAPGPHRHTRFSLYERSGYGMRLDGVSPRVKGLIGSLAQVRDAKMNKIVAIYDSEDLNPPKPVGRFLITADGYIRRTSTEGGEAEMQDATDFAQGLSFARLQ